MKTLNDTIEKISQEIVEMGYKTTFLLDLTPGSLINLLRSHCEMAFKSPNEIHFPVDIECTSRHGDNSYLISTFTINWHKDKGLHLTQQQLENRSKDGSIMMYYQTAISSKHDIASIDVAKQVVIPPTKNWSLPRSYRIPLDEPLEEAIGEINYAMIKKGYNNFLRKPEYGDIMPGMAADYSALFISGSERDLLEADIASPDKVLLPIKIHTISDVNSDKSTFSVCSFALGQKYGYPLIFSVSIQTKSFAGERIACAVLPVFSLNDIPSRKKINEMMKSANEKIRAEPICHKVQAIFKKNKDKNNHI